MRIRYFGFLTNAYQRRRLRQTRAAIEAKEIETADPTPTEDVYELPCPKCRRGRLRVVREIAPRARSGSHRSG